MVKSISTMFGVTELAAKNLIASGFDSLESFRTVTKDDLKAVDQIGDVTAERIVAQSKMLILESDKKELAEKNSALEKENERLLKNTGSNPDCFGDYPAVVGKKCRCCKYHVGCKELS